MNARSAATPRPAATVVPVRFGPAGLEALLTQRPATMAFGPDLHVFPGGAVDAGDSDGAAIARSRLDPAAAGRALGGDLPDDEALAAHVAALRELWEEAGIALVERRGRRADPDPGDLARARAALLDGRATIGAVAADLDLELRTDRLAPLSRWVTPPFVERRFDVRFFVAELPAGIAPAFDPREVVAHRWATPRAALDAMAAGEIDLWVPTSATLQQLEHAPTMDAVRTWLAPGPSAPIRLRDDGPGLVLARLPGAGGIAGQPVNAWVVGRHELVVVDPGDPSEAAADALLAIADARGARIRAIAITSPAPDHAAGAEGLALRLDVPLYAGTGAGHDLPADVHELAEGDRIPAGDLALVALSAPGPRPDHVAWVAAEVGAVLVGDLVGPGPARSLPGPVDGRAWLGAIERVEALAPRRLLPAHGDVPPDTRAALETQRRRLPPG